MLLHEVIVVGCRTIKDYGSVERHHTVGLSTREIVSAEPGVLLLLSRSGQHPMTFR